MVHSKVTCLEDIGSVVMRTVMRGGSREEATKLLARTNGEQAGDTVTMGGKDKSDEKGEEGPARAHASPRNDSPLESPLEK